MRASYLVLTFALILVGLLGCSSQALGQRRWSDIADYGTIAELKGQKRVYLWSNDDVAYDIIEQKLQDCDCFDIVTKPEKAQFVIVYIGAGTITGMSPPLFGYGLTFDGSNIGEFVVLTKSDESTAENPRVRLLFKRRKTQNYSGGITFNRHPALNSVREFVALYKRVNNTKE